MTKENSKEKSKANSFEAKINGNKIMFEVGGLAGQASGSCLVRFGDTSLLCTAQIGQDKPEMGFFPLTCGYEERHYAAGKILGSRFMRREGRPTPEATLNGRMIDRTIRPLFPQGMTSEIQIIATCLSWDAKNDPAVLGMLGASLSLAVSEIPWQGPVGAIRVGRIDNKFILNPTYEQREQGELDVVVSGHIENGEVLINMFDGKANEVAEDVMEQIFDFSKPYIKELIDFQNDIAKKIGNKKRDFVPVVPDKQFQADVKKIISQKLEKAFYSDNKQDYKQGIADLEDEIKAMVVSKYDEKSIGSALNILEQETDKLLKINVLKTGKRPDLRKLDEVREIKTEVGILPRTHGTGLFSRGQTRVLSILTLGSPGDKLLQDGMEVSGKKRFMLHYNFPPYSVGEVGRMGSPGRREIGHGMLAEKALVPLLPDDDKFPYTIRAVSEVVSSNGSSSMASVSAACLALMDAGVPILRPAAGIAIGLIRGAKGEYKILTDIQGPEDHYGEMDFKSAGTEKGITALQMDVKGIGITKDIFISALSAAKKARLSILETQNKTLSAPRKELSPYAPRIYTLEINPSKIGMVIGTGGKTINEIIDTCNVSIDIEDSGQVFVGAEDQASAKKAIEWIENLTKEAKIGEIFQQAEVKKITDFGAFVEILPNQDGLVHISQFAPFHLSRVEDVVKVGDKIPVKVIGIDEATGKISLSAKDAGFSPPKPPAGGGSYTDRASRSDRPTSRFNNKKRFFKR